MGIIIEKDSNGKYKLGFSSIYGGNEIKFRHNDIPDNWDVDKFRKILEKTWDEKTKENPHRMPEAAEVAQQAVDKYFNQQAIIKSESNLTGEQQRIIKLLESNGGKYWEKGNMKRVYFEPATILQLAGYNWHNYNSGNVSSASYNGEKISNSEMRRSFERLAFGKFWYDVGTDKWFQKTNDTFDDWTITVKILNKSIHADKNQSGGKQIDNKEQANDLLNPDTGSPTKTPEPEPKPPPKPVNTEPQKPEIKALPEVNESRLKQINSERKPLSQSADVSRANKTTILPSDPRIKTWVRDPGSMDVLGIDTPPSITKPTRMPREKGVRLSPKTPRLK